jgi:hypothetical protein
LSSSWHQYDLPFNYAGTVISTNFKYKPFTGNLTTLGTKNGYQHLWKEAEAAVNLPFSQFTFLNQQTFYSISSMSGDSAKIFFTRTGANDPDFNLRRDPSYIIRTNAVNQTYINSIEIHGNFDPVVEMSTSAYSAVSAIKKIQDDENMTAVSITVNGKQLVIVQVNKGFDKALAHHFEYDGKQVNWQGPYCVRYDDKEIK